MTNWTQAACRPYIARDIDLWFAPDNEHPNDAAKREPEAKAVCATCPLKAECLEAAEDSEGIWGGLTELERNQDDKPACTDRPGTLLGWGRHRRARQTPCDECAKAKADDTAERVREGVIKSVAHNKKRQLKCGTSSGYSTHTSRGETVCDPCRAARNEYMAGLRGRKKGW